MTMKLVKKTSDYSIYQRGDERYAVKGSDKKPVNGDEKVRILVSEGLITVAEPKSEEHTEEVAADSVDDSDSKSSDEEPTETETDSEEESAAE
ncbi:MAG: hypothetical protein AAF194_05085 [Pseudomonadota bacterium]